MPMIATAFTAFGPWAGLAPVADTSSAGKTFQRFPAKLYGYDFGMMGKQLIEDIGFDGIIQQQCDIW